MIGRFEAWRHLLVVWLPVLILAIGSVALYGWQSSGSLGREAQLAREIEGLEADIRGLERVLAAADTDQTLADDLDGKLEHLANNVFGTLEGRLTRILRAVGTATRNAGLMPDGFTYQAKEERDSGLLRFGIRFTVEGRYEQVRQLLAELQASPEMLIVDRIGFSGEEQAITERLEIALDVSTYVVDADRELLAALLSGGAPTGGPRAESD